MHISTEYIQEHDGSTHVSFVDSPLLLNPGAWSSQSCRYVITEISRHISDIPSSYCTLLSRMFEYISLLFKMGFSPYDNSIYFKIQQQKTETNHKFWESVYWDWVIDKGNKEQFNTHGGKSTWKIIAVSLTDRLLIHSFIHSLHCMLIQQISMDHILWIINQSFNKHYGIPIHSSN